MRSPCKWSVPSKSWFFSWGEKKKSEYLASIVMGNLKKYAKQCPKHFTRVNLLGPHNNGLK